MLRTGWRLLPLLALLGVTGAPVLADVPPDVASALREGKLAPPAAVEALRDGGLTPADAAALLAMKGSGGASGAHTIELTDARGTKTEVLVRVPEGAPPTNGRPVVIALHGLRGHGRDVLTVASRLAPEGAIVMAPCAQYLPPEAENEDMFEIGKDIKEAENDDPKARRREQLQRLLRLARDELFPHWWSYKPDTFALQALAWANQNYPIDPERVVLIGYSMGGYGTWNVGLRYPDRFAGIVPIAGGISRRENTMPRDEVSRALLGNARGLPSFFLHGSSDPIVPVRFSRTISEELKQLGAAHEYIEVPGEGHYLRGFLGGDDSSDQVEEWIAARRRPLHPRRVEHTAVGTYHGSAWWVRIDALRGNTGRVEAEVVESGQVSIRTQGVQSLTVFLDPAIVDVSRPVRIELDGAVVHDGPVASSLEAVVESWAARREPSLVYQHMLKLEVPASTPRSF